MNSKSITYDLDDWEIVSDAENKNLETDEASSFIYNKITENIFNENWYVYSEDVIKNINSIEENNTINSQQECIKNDKKRNTENMTDNPNIINFIRKKNTLPPNKCKIVTIYDFEKINCIVKKLY